MNQQDLRVAGRQQWICRRLKETRQELGLTLAEVGKKMGASPARVSDIESGYYDTKLSSFLKYLDALKVSLANFAEPMPKSPAPDLEKIKNYKKRNARKSADKESQQSS
ncbi:MAG TPA: hypothetical protein DDW52_21930 [Planctomycetaceae bacterium]|nr:hypothetical protein [Planctomycetaceae bacterium]